MLSDLLHSFGIRYFAQIPAAACRIANSRLHGDLPEDCNVIFMLIPYATEAALCCDRISGYGAVWDYHSFAKKLFSALEDYLKKTYSGCFAKGFADHSPFAECDGASRAGLGVVGDHSLLICEEYSSFVFIGELVTDLSAKTLSREGILESTRAEPVFCEHCGACDAACPAGCSSSRDRELCISFLTQKKGELSEEETALIKKGGSIWGCDICQRACPHTKKAVREGTIFSPIDFFRDSYIGDDPLAAVEKMDSETFALYPFAWRKRATIQRNIDIIKGKRSND